MPWLIVGHRVRDASLIWLGIVGVILFTEDLVVLDRLFDVDSPHSLQRRDDLAAAPSVPSGPHATPEENGRS